MGSLEQQREKAIIPDIPVVDFNAWTDNTSQEERLKVARDLVAGCHRTGFIYIKNHGVPAPLLTEAFAWTKKFFDLDEEKKAEAARNLDGLSFRGWVKVGGENIPPVQEEKVKGVVDYNVSTLQDPGIWRRSLRLTRIQGELWHGK
jgi:isopenicillin N synthase-like dioxygenase